MSGSRSQRARANWRNQTLRTLEENDVGVIEREGCEMVLLIRVMVAIWGSLAPASAAFAACAITETHVQVQATGAVTRPGLYRLSAGSRVAELIQRAGGPRGNADLQAMNLARRLEDGERCYIPIRGAAPAGLTGVSPHVRSKPTKARRGNRRRGVPGAKINLNQASPDVLQQLPGIGPNMARRIMAIRQKLGGFSSIDELQEVPGIGPKRLQRLRPMLTV